MNILTDTLPDRVTVAGRDYPVNTDFRAALRTLVAFEDPDLVDDEKTAILLSNLFYDGIPDDRQGAIDAAIGFMRCGEDEDQDDDGPRIFSFSKDARFIFAAFRQTHGIDLETADLHYWKFIALFMDLGAETTFCQLASLRKRIATNKATKEERQAANELGEMFYLDTYETLTERERENIERFNRLAGIK